MFFDMVERLLEPISRKIIHERTLIAIVRLFSIALRIFIFVIADKLATCITMLDSYIIRFFVMSIIMIADTFFHQQYLHLRHPTPIVRSQSQNSNINSSEIFLDPCETYKYNSDYIEGFISTTEDLLKKLSPTSTDLAFNSVKLNINKLDSNIKHLYDMYYDDIDFSNAKQETFVKFVTDAKSQIGDLEEKRFSEFRYLIKVDKLSEFDVSTLKLTRNQNFLIAISICYISPFIGTLIVYDRIANYLKIVFGSSPVVFRTFYGCFKPLEDNRATIVLWIIANCVFELTFFILQTKLIYYLFAAFILYLKCR